jgi:hypothetical protein
MRGVRPRRRHARGEITTQPKLGAEIANRRVSRLWVPAPEAFDRKPVDHPRKSRDLRQLLGRREPPLKRILDSLRGGSGIGRDSTEMRWLTAALEAPCGAAGFANGDHAPSRFGVEHAATSDAPAAADLGEVFTKGRHAVT